MKNSITRNKKPAVDFLYRLLSNCSTRCLFNIAGWLAFIVSRSKNQLSRYARKNIRLCFPDLPADQQQRVMQKSIHHTCCAFFELAALWYRPVPEVLDLVLQKDIDESFLNSKQAKIVIAPHHGSWELLNLWLADSGPLYSLYKPTSNVTLDQFIISKRTRNSAELVPVNTAGLRRLLKGLKQGDKCMILPDQRPGKNTSMVEAPFYGHLAPTSLLIKNLARKVDCNVYIAAITRNLDSGQYHLTVRQLERESFIQDDLASATYLNTSIENFIQCSLEQYQWPYRRFDRHTYND